MSIPYPGKSVGTETIVSPISNYVFVCEKYFGVYRIFKAWQSRCFLRKYSKSNGCYIY